MNKSQSSSKQPRGQGRGKRRGRLDVTVDDFIGALVDIQRLPLLNATLALNSALAQVNGEELQPIDQERLEARVQIAAKTFLENELSRRGIESVTPSERKRALRAIAKGGKRVARKNLSLANAVASDVRLAAHRKRVPLPFPMGDVYAEIDLLREHATDAADWIDCFMRPPNKRHSGDLAMQLLLSDLESIWDQETGDEVHRSTTKRGSAPNDDASAEVGAFFVFVQCVLHALAAHLPHAVDKLMPDRKAGLRQMTREAIVMNWRRARSEADKSVI